MRRVYFLNRFYWPEEPATGQLLTDLSVALAAAGFAVKVLTSAPRTAAVPRREVRLGVEICRLRTPRLGGRGALARAFDWAVFSVAALWRIGRETRRGDTLVLLTDPPLLAVLATPLARWRGVRVIQYLQDIYPELAETLNGTRGLGWIRAWRNHAWRQADACVVLSRDMATLLEANGLPPERIHQVPNWAPEGLHPTTVEAAQAMREKWGLAGRFIVAYSGNLGRVHELDPVLEIAAAMRSVPEMVFVFIGDGAQRPGLEAQVRARGLANVRFLPHQPRSDLAASLGAADVHLVTLRSGCEALVFPSKLYGIAAAGRPVLFIGPRGCELAHQVEAHAMGRAFDRNEVADIAATLRRWLHQPDLLAACARGAAAFAAANGGLSRATADWHALLTEARQPPASVSSRLQPPS